jgi:ABC-type oligopeptide transport system substrate-binding subunit/class 3 adenylate cyclase
VRALRRLAPKAYVDRLLAASGEMAGERRMVTILMADIKGSSGMARDLDPEEWMGVMEGAFRVLIEPIARYEGTVARLEGDAILAFFGAPIAHEDDPERGCRAGLEIVEGARGYAARLERERGVSGFGVRVGIHTGQVVVGEVGADLRMEYTAMGEAPNLAARLEGAAEPGTVLISGATHRFVKPLLETEALEPIKVKGWEEPVAIYRVFAARDEVYKVRGIPGLESPLVGREAECAALQESLERLQAGVGGIVTIVGEAGLGKSRLVAELRNRAQAAQDRSPARGSVGLGVQWVEGRCLSYGTSVAYLLWLDVVRALLGVTLEDAAADVRVRLRERVQALCPGSFDDVHHYLARWMSLPLSDEEEAVLRDLDGEQLKNRTFGAMETLIECAAARPLVLVCEDMHWADPTSLELLESLLALTDRTSLLLVCVFRPVREHGSWGIREVAARDYGHRHTRIELEPLTTDESQVLVANLLRLEDLPLALKERMLEAAEGNPLYVEEIIRSLIDEEAIARDEASGRWLATRAVSDIPVPETLEGVLLARIDRLQQDTRRVLQMASVIGRMFLYRLLEALVQEERRLDAHLLALQREEMIRERARIPELEYIFKHQLTREAAYNGLLRRERRTFHRQVGEALEQLYPDRVEEQLGLLAYHWERTGDAEKAAEYLLRAGDQARILYAHREAIDFYQRALPLLKEQERYERAARTLMKLGLTYHTAFDFAKSREAYEEGLELWHRAASAPPDLVGAEYGLQTLRVQYRFDPSDLDPVTQRGNENLLRQVFSGLVEQTVEMDIVPDVARSWDVLEGGRRYVFHLRNDVRWSDGAPVTADDFVYAWKRLLDPATASPHANLLYDIKGARAFHQGEQSEDAGVGARALDEHTLEVELEGPTGYFLQLLGHARTLPVPRHAVQQYGASWTDVVSLVSNGPFRVERWCPGEKMVLRRNPDYHRRYRGNIQRVELHPATEMSSDQLELYEADHLDVLDFWTLPPRAMGLARNRHAGEYLVAPRLATVFLAFNARRPPFDDVRVRRAFALAADRQTVSDVVLGGYAITATGGFVPPGMPGHSPGIGLPYDPEEARRLLSEAGYPPGGSQSFPVVELLGAPDDELPYQHLGTNWAENLGVETASTIVEWDCIPVRLTESPPHIWGWGWGADYPDPDNFLRVGVPRAWIGWQHEVYDRLVEEARRITDQGKRMNLYRQADRILVEEAAVCPAAYSRSHLLVKPWVKVYPVSAMGGWCWKDVIIEPH